MKKEQRKTIYYLIIVIGWGILSFIASQYIVAILMGFFLGERLSEPFWMLIYYVLNYSLAITLTFYLLPRVVNLFKRRRAQKNKEKVTNLDQPNEFSAQLDESGLGDWPTFVDIGLAPIGYVAYIMLSNLLTGIFSHFSWFDAGEAQDVGFSGFIAGSNRVWAILAIVFVAPIAEEIIMRGWLYSKVRRKLPIWAAILLISVVFGAMHGQWNAGVATFALSVVLCGLREITGTVWSGMILHILSNGIAFYILYIANAGIM